MMSTLLAPQRPSGIPDPLQLPGRAPRTTLADRVAMRIALALLLWSTRPTNTRDHLADARAHELRLARRLREHEWARSRLLLPHIR